MRRSQFKRKEGERKKEVKVRSQKTELLNPFFRMKIKFKIPLEVQMVLKQTSDLFDRETSYYPVGQLVNDQ